MKKKVCVVTGTRAEYGLLRNLIQRIEDDCDLDLLLCVTGSHLSEEFGYTYKEIEADGYKIGEKVDIKLDSDDSIGIAKSMALALIGFTEVFVNHNPNMVVLLGDRYEMLSIASAAMISRIPIAHLYGGEATYGVIDEAIRHSITKMSYLHFASTEQYRKRIIQLGENPDRVYNVGALGVENIRNMHFISKEALENDLNITLDGKVILVTYHPVTLEKDMVEEQFVNLLEALRDLQGLYVIFTKGNADTGGKIISQMIDKFVLENFNQATAFTSLGSKRYLSLLKHVDVVVGNSSSGIIEAPSFKIPTVNIGDRQKGRIQANTIINCGTSREEILEAINLALSDTFMSGCIDTVNPYETKETSGTIYKIIKSCVMYNSINLKKAFFDIWGKE